VDAALLLCVIPSLLALGALHLHLGLRRELRLGAIGLAGALGLAIGLGASTFVPGSFPLLPLLGAFAGLVAFLPAFPMLFPSERGASARLILGVILLVGGLILLVIGTSIVVTTGSDKQFGAVIVGAPTAWGGALVALCGGLFVVDALASRRQPPPRKGADDLVRLIDDLYARHDVDATARARALDRLASFARIDPAPRRRAERLTNAGTLLLIVGLFLGALALWLTPTGWSALRPARTNDVPEAVTTVLAISYLAGSAIVVVTTGLLAKGLGLLHERRTRESDEAAERGIAGLREDVLDDVRNAPTPPTPPAL
jgi:hypothetical protein